VAASCPSRETKSVATIYWWFFEHPGTSAILRRCRLVFKRFGEGDIIPDALREAEGLVDGME